MKPEDIKAGRTYVGKGGRRRRAENIFGLSQAGNRWIIRYSYFHGGVKRKTGLLDAFAAWAEKEVPS
jgi:hypothetical protein